MQTSAHSQQTSSSNSHTRSAAQEAARRRALLTLARNYLPHFVRYVSDLEPQKHHEILCWALQEIVDGRMPRAMVFMPPGGAKSTYTSVFAPAFAVGRRPGIALIAASHTRALARQFGRRVRNTIRDPLYGHVFPTILDPSSSAAHEWHTFQTAEGDPRTSSYFAAGIGTGIAGRRADIAIIDDPFKTRQDADSQVKRDAAWAWYTDDLRTRLKPGGSIALVQTRWHEDDVAGRILPEGYNGESGWIRARDGEMWFVISMQALAERDDDILGRKPGESYWPNYYTREALEQQRITLPSRSWAALYQQRPSPEEGDYYRREWFQWYDELPKHVRYYGASDYAVTQDGGDYTVHLVGAVAGPAMMEELYLCDYWTGQTDASIWIDEFIRLVRQWQPVGWGEESGQIIRSLDSVITLQQQRHDAWTAREQFASSFDKAQRGQAFRALAAQRRVYLPRQAPWAKDFLERLVRFGSAKRDDDHDAASLLGRMIYQMRGGKDTTKPSSVPAYGTYDYLLWITDQQRQTQESIYRSK